jgi:hypothetical protein
VTFKYKTEEFPHRNFPPGEQLGWIADEVQVVIPGWGMVEADSEGFKAVAYARAGVLAAAAVKELKEKYEGEIQELKEQVAFLMKHFKEKEDENKQRETEK